MSPECVAGNEAFFAVENYDLATTLSSGQAFRWKLQSQGWESVIAGRWVCLNPTRRGIMARTVLPETDWSWLGHYLQVDLDFPSVLNSFPRDEHLLRASSTCAGLRL